jgi:hypothetical protein
MARCYERKEADVSLFGTILTGGLVFCAGQFVLKFIIELAQEQAKAISEVCFRLIHYAPWYANPGPRTTDEQQEKMQEASHALRECASRLQATTSVIYWYPFLQSIRIVPSRVNVEEAIGHLIRLSNSIESGSGRENSQDADRVFLLLTGHPRRFSPP